MKNPVRNVVVEYKNKRARKGNVSLWGNLDLKSIAREVEADAPPAPIDVGAQPELPEPPDNEAAVKRPEIGPQMVTDEAVEGERKFSVVNTVDPERILHAPDQSQKTGTTEKIVVRGKTRNSSRSARKDVSQKTKKAIRPAKTDIRAELSLLEQENLSLKRKLFAKLNAENEKLVAMLERAEQRSTLTKR